MNRRGFLRGLFGTAAALALDQEKLLWVPGAKLISIPTSSRNQYLMISQISYEMLEVLHRNIVTMRMVNRNYEAYFGVAPIGQQVQIRRPRAFAV